MKAKHLLKLIPPSIRITKEAIYEVLHSDVILNDSSGGDQLGECRPDPRQILLKNGKSPTETFKTFIHETLHAIDFETKDLKLTHKQVYKLEEAIYKVLKLNGFI